MALIPATLEAEAGGSKFKATLGKSVRPNLKIKIRRAQDVAKC